MLWPIPSAMHGEILWEPFTVIPNLVPSESCSAAVPQLHRSPLNIYTLPFGRYIYTVRYGTQGDTQRVLRKSPFQALPRPRCARLQYGGCRPHLPPLPHHSLLWLPTKSYNPFLSGDTNPSYVDSSVQSSCERGELVCISANMIIAAL